MQIRIFKHSGRQLLNNDEINKVDSEKSEVNQIGITELPSQLRKKNPN